ncbi:MAG: sigma-E processing peptidase SpoIIGA [Bacillota bacterium]|nr:sigma-E processing peptidase SpoIIGA [Bacillota bacterium]
MIVYGELLFFENAVTGYVLLYLTGCLLHHVIRGAGGWLRLAAGGICCGLFSMVIFLQIKMPVTVLMEIAFSLVVCIIAFGRAKLHIKAAVFIGITYFMGGVTMGLLLATGNTGIYAASGIYTGDMKAAVLAVFTAVFFAAAKQLIRVFYKAKFYNEHNFSVVIMVGESRAEAEAFLDTGNCLKDPVSGSPAAVADEILWERMESAGMIMQERFCVIPYETVDSSGVMAAVRVDCITIGERCIRNCIIARGGAGNDFKMTGKAGCELLLSRYMAETGV